MESVDRLEYLMKVGLRLRLLAAAGYFLLLLLLPLQVNGQTFTANGTNLTVASSDIQVSFRGAGGGYTHPTSADDPWRPALKFVACRWTIQRPDRSTNTLPSRRRNLVPRRVPGSFQGFCHGHPWPEVREAQALALSLPKTAMAVTIDIGDADDVHPKNKQAVGQRLALAARSVAYGQHLVYSGPNLQTMKVAGDKVHLNLDCADGGLVGKCGPLRGFEIAGNDRHFVEAEAEINGNAVTVRSPRVPRPAAVGYGWADNPKCNLYNGAGLPASPFPCKSAAQRPQSRLVAPGLGLWFGMSSGWSRL